MRIIIIIILTSLSNVSFCQEQFNLENDYKVDWGIIESKNDSIAKVLGSTNETLKFRYENFPELFHLVNLNNDLLPDAIFYWPNNSNEPIFEIYLNYDGVLKLELEKRGTIVKLEADKFFGSLKFTLNEIAYVSTPFLNRLHKINISSKGIIENETILYFGGTLFPTKFELYHRFEVSQTKYRLRKTPSTDEQNIICELTVGDTGLALSSKTDKTGRVWWFVIVDNNIVKKIENY